MDMLQLKGVGKYVLDMCQYGLTTKGADGADGLAKKTTTLMTNSSVMGEFLGRRCCGGHKHIPLIGGSRCSKAAVYTNRFAEAIVEAYKLHLKAQKKLRTTTTNTDTINGKSVRRGSLNSRNKMDLPLDGLEINDDDPNDVPSIDELMEI